MGCLRAEKILDYIADPLRKCLRDENPYVRKTAALGVMKLYDMKPSLAIDNGFIEMLQEMVTDSNPMVRLSSPRSCHRGLLLTLDFSGAGRRQRRRRPDRDPRGSRGRAHLCARLAGHFAPAHCPRRVHRVGPNSDSGRRRKVRGRGREGVGAHLRARHPAVPARQRERRAGRYQGALSLTGLPGTPIDASASLRSS